MSKEDNAPQGGGFGGRALTAEEEAKRLEDRAKAAEKAVEDKAVRGPREQQKP